jgi:hypothetical protein
MTGWQSQSTGDIGQALVEAELTRAGFLVGRLDPDPGEDLWAELDGRQAAATGSFPQRALFQVKATSKPIDELVLDLKVDHLKRWAAQPVPVYIVGVETQAPRFFIKSVDEIIADDLDGKNVFDLNFATIRVRLPATAELGRSVRENIESHYRALRLNLAELPDVEVKSRFFEVLSTRTPEVFDRIPIATWFVLWKSAPRPQHFGAMLAELTRRATEAYRDSHPLPAYFIFHVYRSLEDRHMNLALARVDVVNPLHPKQVKVREVLGITDAYRVRHGRDVDECRSFFQAKTTDAEGFRRYAAIVGAAFDILTKQILSRRNQGREIWDEALDRELTAADHLWNDGPFAPPECSAIDDFLNKYYGHLLAHNHVARRRANELPADTLDRLLRGEESKLAACHGAWQVVVNIGR